jgi:tetratricopeptide (TPR) repeat protein
MKPRALSAGLLLAAVTTSLLGGCVYYNGMYNANRLARSAKKAEREGRTFEANNLWGQVATKAESVVVRHPTSKYAERARVLNGIALARLGQCEQAMAPLSRIAVVPMPTDLSEDALLATGRCQMTLGNPEAADAAFGRVLESKDADRRREARFQHARLLRQAGRFQEALSALANDRQARADHERILALSGAKRLPEALALTDSLMAKDDTTRLWDSVAVALGQQDPSAATRLVDRVRRLPKLRRESLARLLLEDGLRLVPTDTARAAKRFREAVAAGASGDAAGTASLELVRLELRRASRPEDLVPAIDTLKGLASRYEATGPEIIRLGSIVAQVHKAGGPVTMELPQGDLRLFLAGELARDSLQAPRLAQSMFRRIADQWADSPYAPKAILAAQQLDSTFVDSARVLLEARYVDSPYLAIVRGEDSPAYRQLEDSLGAFAASLVPQRPPPGAQRKPVAAPPPGRRPQPAAGGSRVPEPQ